MLCVCGCDSHPKSRGGDATRARFFSRRRAVIPRSGGRRQPTSLSPLPGSALRAPSAPIHAPATGHRLPIAARAAASWMERAERREKGQTAFAAQKTFCCLREEQALDCVYEGMREELLASSSTYDSTGPAGVFELLPAAELPPAATSAPQASFRGKRAARAAQPPSLGFLSSLQMAAGTQTKSIWTSCNLCSIQKWRQGVFTLPLLCPSSAVKPRGAPLVRRCSRSSLRSS